MSGRRRAKLDGGRSEAERREAAQSLPPLSLVEEHGHPLAWAAAEAGYADQPHLTRECNDLAGLPPGELLAVRNVQDAS